MATTPFPTGTETPGSSPAGQAGAGSAGSASRSESQRADDARRLSERIAQNAHTLVDRAVDKLAPAVDRLKLRVSEAGSTLHHSADQLGEMQDRWVDDSRSSIRSHPLTWVCAAFAVGMVIGRMQSHR